MEQRLDNLTRQTANYISENIGAKLIMTAMTGLVLFGFRLFGIPEDDVHCIDDKVHDFLNPVNRFLNQNVIYANGFIISSSFFMDVISLSIFTYWLFFVRNTRFILTIILFYGIRSAQLHLFHMRFPFGYYWNDPKIVSLTVPYGRTSDFFFSGHCGFLAICFFEWRALGWKKISYLTLVALIYLAFVLLTLRVHYSIDITTGVVFAHYIHIHATYYHEKIEKSIYAAQIYLTKLFQCKQVEESLRAEASIYKNPETQQQQVQSPSQIQLERMSNNN